MAEVDVVVNACNAIDRQLEGGYGYCFYQKPLTEAEKAKVVSRVINSRWVTTLDAYNCTDYQGKKGVLFVWNDDIQELKKYYAIK